MTSFLFSKIYRFSIIFLFTLFTISIFNISSHNLGEKNICSSEKKEIDEKCGINCFCDRDHLIYVTDYRRFFSNKCENCSHKSYQNKIKFIEEKANYPPII